MELEKQRGVSVSTSVMSFMYKEMIINLLDTPGHADFSEDTYRTLTAVDSVLMVIDSTKGVEERTIKLLDVCRMRNTPVITFMNKLDREGLNPFSLLDDVEKQLKIKAVPLTWPISMGKNFQGVYDLVNKSLMLFKANTKQSDSIIIKDINSSEIETYIDQHDSQKLREDLEMIHGAIEPFNIEQYLQGNVTPVFFGSAINNFGIKELLDNFLLIAPSPSPRPTLQRIINPEENKFSAFVFKIHANMDSKHRDRIAFMRICSGHFERGMKVKHVRLNREIKVSNPITFMANSRSIIEEAFAGDIIGVHDTGLLKIGDTFSDGENINFLGIPSFSPEIFKQVINKDPMKTKQLQKGLQQLSEEGAVQLFKPIIGLQLILGAVGILQFDVVQFRLENEYSAQCTFEPVDFTHAYWVKSKNQKALDKFINENKDKLAYDTEDKLVYFIRSIWTFSRILETYPDIEFYKTSECSEKDLVKE